MAIIYKRLFGYSRDHTLCKSVVSMLLACAPGTAGYAGRMLSEMIRASVNFGGSAKSVSANITTRQFQRRYEEVLKYMQPRVRASRPYLKINVPFHNPHQKFLPTTSHLSHEVTGTTQPPVYSTHTHPPPTSRPHPATTGPTTPETNHHVPPRATTIPTQRSLQIPTNQMQPHPADASNLDYC
uniref:Uncharacterized protein n=1 Tax=Ixodes ricinus TaxID=34613 RepID=V5GP06_IXORI